MLRRDNPSSTQQYREIFHLYAKQGKITPEDLSSMFALIGLHPTTEEFEKYCNIVFEGSGKANFDGFNRLFKMKCTSKDYTSDEIVKSFRLLSREDGKLPMDTIHRLIREQTTDEAEVRSLMEHMSQFKDPEGFLDVQGFIKSTF
jgi:Ca2+-binding EF-hand superfamily protein